MQQVGFEGAAHGSEIELSRDASVDGEGLVEKEAALEEIFHLCPVKAGNAGGQTELLVFEQLLAGFQLIDRFLDVDFWSTVLLELADMVSLIKIKSKFFLTEHTIKIVDNGLILSNLADSI